jgi:long-chain fatty acid transport protein
MTIAQQQSHRMFSPQHASTRSMPHVMPAVATGCAALMMAVTLATTDAAAAGFATARFGGEHGHATTTNPTALYFNPAGIALAEGIHLFADGTLALRSVTWQHTEPAGGTPTPAGGDGANDGTAELFNVFGAPMLGATVSLGSLALGAAIFVPFGGRVHWSQNEAFVDSDYPLAADGVQRWHSIRGAITHLYASAGAAYRFGPLSFGATINLIRSEVMSVRAKNFAGDTLPNLESEGRATTDVSSVHGSYGLGVLLEALPDQLWFGASYQAQPGLGPIEHGGTLTIEDRGAKNDLAVTLHEALPDIIRLGGRFRPVPAWELRLFGDLTRWSVSRTTCLGLEGEPCVVTATGADPNGGVIPLNLLRGWNDTIGMRAGVSHWPRPRVELFAGAGFETAATTDETIDPELPDANNIAGALGARWQVMSGFFVCGSYTHIQYLARDNSGKSILTLADVPTRRPDAGGRYEQWIGIVNANVELEF